MKIIKTIGVSLASLLVAMPTAALTVGISSDTNVAASTSVGEVKVSAAIQARITKAKDRANQEIDRRLKAFADLNDRVKVMVRLSEDSKASISSTIILHTSELTDLKAKI